jgi:hypothetical protein
MGDHLGYAVVTFNQASHQPELNYSDLHPDVEQATWELEAKREETAKVGRGERHVIAEVIELEDGDG